MAHVHQPKANLIQASQPPTPQTRLIPVNQWPDHHPWPTVGGLRWMIFKAKTNGFDTVVRRVGRRVLIDEAAFFEWVEARNEESSRWD